MNDHSITKIVNRFKQDIKPESRYASFDYCYRYFHPRSEIKLTDDMEKSCLMLGFYLASWGMFRGSSNLLTKSFKYYEPLIVYIENADGELWEIDVSNYTDENISLIIDLYDVIRGLITESDKTRHVVLTTKVMLGVFGNIPAFDQYFTDTFSAIFSEGKSKCGFTTVYPKALKCIAQFYDHNKSEINRLAKNQKVLSYGSQNDIELTYPKAKVVDMYGFAKSFYPIE